MSTLVFITGGVRITIEEENSNLSISANMSTGPAYRQQADAIKRMVANNRNQEMRIAQLLADTNFDEVKVFLPEREITYMEVIKILETTKTNQYAEWKISSDGKIRMFH